MYYCYLLALQFEKMISKQFKQMERNRLFINKNQQGEEERGEFRAQCSLSKTNLLLQSKGNAQKIPVKQFTGFD